MKLKYLFLVLMLFSSIFAANAQWESKTSKANVSLGFGFGGNYSFVKSSSTTLNPDFRGGFGFSGGLVLNVRFLPRDAWSSASTGILAFQPEVRYSSTRFSIDNSSMALNYITVPAMFQVYPTKKLYFEIGPEFALNISHSPDNVALSDTQFNISKLKANDCKLGVGMGARFNWFMLGTRYNIGFSDFASNLQWRQSYLQINMSFLFGLQKKGF